MSCVVKKNTVKMLSFGVFSSLSTSNVNAKCGNCSSKGGSNSSTPPVITNKNLGTGFQAPTNNNLSGSGKGIPSSFTTPVKLGGGRTINPKRKSIFINKSTEKIDHRDVDTKSIGSVSDEDSNDTNKTTVEKQVNVCSLTDMLGNVDEVGIDRIEAYIAKISLDENISDLITNIITEENALKEEGIEVDDKLAEINKNIALKLFGFIVSSTKTLLNVGGGFLADYSGSDKVLNIDGEFSASANFIENFVSYGDIEKSKDLFDVLNKYISEMLKFYSYSEKKKNLDELCEVLRKGLKKSKSVECDKSIYVALTSSILQFAYCVQEQLCVLFPSLYRADKEPIDLSVELVASDIFKASGKDDGYKLLSHVLKSNFDELMTLCSKIPASDSELFSIVGEKGHETYNVTSGNKGVLLTLSEVVKDKSKNDFIKYIYKYTFGLGVDAFDSSSLVVKDYKTLTDALKVDFGTFVTLKYERSNKNVRINKLAISSKI